MSEKKYLFEDFAQDLLKDDDFREWVDYHRLANEKDCLLEDFPELKDDYQDDETLEDWMSRDHDEFLQSNEPFTLAFESREMLLAYLDHYYDAASEYYDYWEHQFGGFNGFMWPFSGVFKPNVLALCVRYFESINEKEKAGRSCFFIMCSLCPAAPYDDPFIGGGTFFYDTFEYLFGSIKQYIHNDWWRVHPTITRNIGCYYLSVENYSKAMEFFSLGASLDYDERQSGEPFIAVGVNQYELGMIYYKGLGMEKDNGKALQWFKEAYDNGADEEIPELEDILSDEGIL